ncbi:hypothetical protein [uncultured Fusobacterium sp.]|jgi:hypothetical protein|uniref:hypothetical protein n=1 Tax=uncultured Fusobacterium sp. TaxID=159267 RepID=UPI0025EE304A|nr:hypothetical protein [uncultured Fusobacterium sp.]
MEDKFIIFNGVLCSKYLTRMRGYAERDLEDELKKRKISFSEFLKITEKVYNQNKIESLKFRYSELDKIIDGTDLIFSLPFSGCEELLNVYPNSLQIIKLPVLKKEEEILFILKKNKKKINLKNDLKDILIKINEVSLILKEEVENYNNDLKTMLKRKEKELYF